ncbi:MAG: hypothetical protein EOP04_19630 [Proteobacteria bacterium]|nr:MAG: hypothetical protein EOP04_19630 [Pseudomonadota bacterium]
MKKYVLGFLLFSPLSVYASTTSNQVVCGLAHSFYYKEYSRVAYEPDNQPSARARASLNSQLKLFPLPGSAGVLEGRPVQVTTLSVSKPDTESNIRESTREQCPISRVGQYPGSCESVSICATVTIAYQDCKPTKFDENTGKRYAVCPNGSRIEF